MGQFSIMPAWGCILFVCPGATIEWLKAIALLCKQSIPTTAAHWRVSCKLVRPSLVSAFFYCSLSLSLSLSLSSVATCTNSAEYTICTDYSCTLIIYPNLVISEFYMYAWYTSDNHNIMCITMSWLYVYMSLNMYMYMYMYVFTVLLDLTFFPHSWQCLLVRQGFNKWS